MSHAHPILFSGGASRALERIPLYSAGAAAAAAYTEKWLQELIQRCPEVLPTAEIEPGFGQLIPVAMEVSCGHGWIDNLFVTAEGGIVLVETKLWRNPESRRTVVSQALDYAAALSRVSYAEFERAILAAQTSADEAKPSSLYAIVSDQADALEESAFIDALSLNLRRGRMLVIAAGDGIRTEAEALADLLQSHAGARFTFALVAIELFRAPDDQILAVPRTIAKTVLIERGVVRVEEGRVVVEPLATGSAGHGVTPPRTTMTEELFLELMDKRSAALPMAIRDLLAKAHEIGVKADWKASLNLKWYGDETTVNLGYIRRDGTIATDTTFYTAKASPAARRYLERFAALAGGRVVQNTDSVGPYAIAADGKSSIRIEQVLPSKAEAWVELMAAFVREMETEAAAKVA